MYDTEKYQLLTCYHCGNRGLMPIEFRHKHDFSYLYENEAGEVVDVEAGDIYSWHVLSCPVCSKVTLWQRILDPVCQITEDSTLYPASTFNYEGVPENIKTAFESALKVKNIDTAICALALRRVLEAICKDKGAKGKDLEKMIANMIERGILPAMFDDACWIIRQLGNSAAHADKKVFPVHRVDQTIEFIQSIISYLYALPVKMQKLRNAIELEKEISKGDSDHADA